MTTVTENDLKRLEDLIINFREEVKEEFKAVKEEFKAVNTKIERLAEQVNAVQVDLAHIKGEMIGINKRLDNQEFTNRAVIITILGALLTLLLKISLPWFPGNP